MFARFVHRALSRFFAYEEISGDGRRAYLHRWVLWRWTRGRALYLHRFIGSDWSRDLHDHPKPFLSVGLFGAYVEETPLAHGRRQSRTFRAPWVRIFSSTHIHRLRLVEPGRECWTLVYVGEHERPWGFWIDGADGSEFVGWHEYTYGPKADAGFEPDAAR